MKWSLITSLFYCRLRALQRRTNCRDNPNSGRREVPKLLNQQWLELFLQEHLQDILDRWKCKFPAYLVTDETQVSGKGERKCRRRPAQLSQPEATLTIHQWLLEEHDHTSATKSLGLATKLHSKVVIWILSWSLHIFYKQIWNCWVKHCTTITVVVYSLELLWSPIFTIY